MTRKPKKQRGSKPQEYHGKPPSTGNKHLAEQKRKILRTHYASKYRVR